VRCHSRLGQPQLALRQHNALAAALRAELQLAPAPATTGLAAPNPPARTGLSRPGPPQMPRRAA